MGMRNKCISAIEASMGRNMTQAERVNVEGKIAEWRAKLARDDPAAWRMLSEDQQIAQAAIKAGEDIVRAATRKRINTAQNIIKLTRIRDYLVNHPRNGEAQLNLSRLMAAKGDGLDNVQSVETLQNSILKTALSKLSVAIETVGPKFFGFLENRESMVQVIKALRGEKVDLPEAQQFAVQFKEIANELRKMFNARGGDIGYLENWHNPTGHSRGRIAAYGRDRWVDDAFNHYVDLSTFVHPDGRLMVESEIRDVIGMMFDSITMGGLNKANLAKYRGQSSLANRHSASRSFHFRDADAWIKYHEKFGDKDILATMIDHLSRMANDIAIIDIFGPGGERNVQYLMQLTKKMELNADRGRQKQIDKDAWKNEMLWKWVSGNQKTAVSVGIQRFFDVWRNLLVGARLGSSAITSLSDEATLALTANVNGMSYMKTLKEQASLMGSTERRRHMRRLGLGLDTMIFAMNRIGQEYVAGGLSHRVATAATRMGGLNFMTDVRKQAFGVTMMDSVGYLTKKHNSIHDLDKADNRLLLSKGITDTDWQVWKLARLDDTYRGHELLTPEAIMDIPDAALAHLGGNPERLKQNASLKLLGSVLEESDFAVITPGARELAFMYKDVERGTISGELYRSFWLFKSFSVAMIMKHFSRAKGLGHGKTGAAQYTAPAAYLASLAATTTLMGTAAVQLAEIAKGNDPVNVNPFEGENGKRNLLRGFLKGGALGIYGDLLFSDRTRYGSDALGLLAGPMLGQMGEFIALTQGNLATEALGKESSAGGDMVRFARGFTVGSSLWWAKAGFDHMVWQQLQEHLNPGYNARARRRMKKEYGQTSWWEMGREAPHRAPEFDKMFGE